jgi:hypothetical protein
MDTPPVPQTKCPSVLRLRAIHYRVGVGPVPVDALLSVAALTEAGPSCSWSWCTEVINGCPVLRK